MQETTTTISTTPHSFDDILFSDWSFKESSSIIGTTTVSIRSNISFLSNPFLAYNSCTGSIGNSKQNEKSNFSINNNHAFPFYNLVPPQEIEGELFKLSNNSNSWVLIHGQYRDQLIGLTRQVSCASWKIAMPLLTAIHSLLEPLSAISIETSSHAYRGEDLHIEVCPSLDIFITIRGSYGRVGSEFAGNILGLMYRDFELARLIDLSVTSVLSYHGSTISAAASTAATATVTPGVSTSDCTVPVSSSPIVRLPLRHHHVDGWSCSSKTDVTNCPTAASTFAEADDIDIDVDDDIDDVDFEADSLSVLSLLWPTSTRASANASATSFASFMGKFCEHHDDSNINDNDNGNAHDKGMNDIGQCQSGSTPARFVVATYTQSEIERLHEDSGIAPHLLTIPFDMQNLVNERNFASLKSVIDSAGIPQCTFHGKYEQVDLALSESVPAVFAIVLEYAPDFVFHLQTLQLSAGYSMVATYQLTGRCSHTLTPGRKASTQRHYEQFHRILHNNPVTDAVQDLQRLAFHLDQSRQNYVFTTNLVFTFTTNLRKEKVLRVTMDSTLVDVRGQFNE